MAETNIVEKCKWTLSTEKSYLKKAPRIYVRSSEIKDNDLINATEAFLNSVKTGNGIDYYKKMHKLENTEDWQFPFFSDEVRGFTNNWADTYVGSTNGSQIAGGELVGNIKDVASNIAASVGAFNAIANKQAGSLFEPPKFYQYAANDNAVTLEFTLINTDEEEDYKKHYEVVKKLITDNRFQRESGMIAIPPRVHEVLVPGYRFIQYASCNVSVNLLGRRELKEGLIVPEGYRVNLTYTSLYTEPAEYKDKYTRN